jgi:hypothetical protein
VRWVRFPIATSSSAGVLVVVLRIIAVVTSLLVLRVLSIPVTARNVSGHNGNISPHGWMPIGIIVTLLLALKSIGITSRILAGVLSIVGISGILISSEEISITKTSVAVIEEGERLMATDSVVVLVGLSNLSCAGIGLGITSGISWSTILDGISAGILPDNIALNVAIRTTGMLVVPLEVQF